MSGAPAKPMRRLYEDVSPNEDGSLLSRQIEALVYAKAWQYLRSGYSAEDVERIVRLGATRAVLHAEASLRESKKKLGLR